MTSFLSISVHSAEPILRLIEITAGTQLGIWSRHLILILDTVDLSIDNSLHCVYLRAVFDLLTPPTDS